MKIECMDCAVALTFFFFTIRVQNLEKQGISIWFRLAVIDILPGEALFFILAAGVFWFFYLDRHFYKHAWQNFSLSSELKYRGVIFYKCKSN